MIDINGSLQTWDVELPVHITLEGYVPMEIDGFTIMEHHGEWINGRWTFDSGVPFYQWKHHATAQGWLFYQNAKK